MFFKYRSAVLWTKSLQALAWPVRCATSYSWFDCMLLEVFEYKMAQSRISKVLPYLTCTVTFSCPNSVLLQVPSSGEEATRLQTRTRDREASNDRAVLTADFDFSSAAVVSDAKSTVSNTLSVPTRARKHGQRVRML